MDSWRRHGGGVAYHRVLARPIQILGSWGLLERVVDQSGWGSLWVLVTTFNLGWGPRDLYGWSILRSGDNLGFYRYLGVYDGYPCVASILRIEFGIRCRVNDLKLVSVHIQVFLCKFGLEHRLVSRLSLIWIPCLEFDVVFGDLHILNLGLNRWL